MKSFTFPDHLPNHVIRVSYLPGVGVFNIDFVLVNDDSKVVARQQESVLLRMERNARRMRMDLLRDMSGWEPYTTMD